MPKFGDLVRIKGTYSQSLGSERPVGGSWNGKTGVVIRGPFYEEETGSIDVYLVRLDPGSVEGKESNTYYVKCLWNTLEYLGESLDKEIIESQLRWEHEFFDN